jgi:hypothetical protein
VKVFVLTPVNPGWTATVKGIKIPVIALAVVEHTVSGSHTYSKTETVAMISTGKEIVPANLQEGFESINPPA